MGANFNINPNFQINNFNQNLNDFNKIFSNSIQEGNKAFGQMNGAQAVSSANGASEFEKVLNSMPPLEASLNYVDNARKVENLSPSAKMANDIGLGISDSLNELNSAQKQAEQDIETFASGGDISIHDVMISARKSTLAMQMAIQLRNQVLNTYNELRNMQV